MADLPKSSKEDGRQATAKLFAQGARNGVEKLHANDAFNDGQAPVLNRLIRGRIYEVLIALNTETDAAGDWLLENSDIDEDDPLLATLPVACDSAAREFAAQVELSPTLADDLSEAARAGVTEAIGVYYAAMEGDEAARQQLAWLSMMIPEYWEEPEARPEFLARLGIERPRA